MRGLSYERLERITKIEPHYRGNTNRFPIGSRRQNNRFFLVRNEDGQRVFDIVYGYRWQTHVIDKEEYERRSVAGEEGLNKYPEYDDDKGKIIDGEYSYRRHEKFPKVLGTVRSDETFEFVADNYYQGDMGFLSDYANGYFTTNSRRGGMVYTHPASNKFFPVWRGMKVKVHEMMPTEPFKVVIHHVERKKSKELLKGYEHFFKVSEVMAKNMTMPMAIETVREILNEEFNDNGGYTHWHSPDDYIKIAKERMDSAPLDAFLLYSLAYGIGRFAYMVRWDNQRLMEEETVGGMYMNFKRRLSKDLYKENPIFKEVEYEGGKKYPACDWGVKVIVNGQEVEQL